MATPRKPVIGIICDAFPRDGNSDRIFHGVSAEYVRAIHLGTRCMPLLVPVTIHAETDWQALCDMLDGLLLTGSRTNVHPQRYSGSASKVGTLHDLQRDNTAFGLIDTAMQYQIPVFGICRGFQEINVALGGTLHQQLTSLEGKQDHAEHMALAQGEQYQPAHSVNLTNGGYLQTLLGKQRIEVNSLHNQGINQLAETLSQEAISDDSVIEAFSLPNADHFLIAVQWHPEWHIDNDPVSKKLFNAFDLAVHDYAKLKCSINN